MSHSPGPWKRESGPLPDWIEVRSADPNRIDAVALVAREEDVPIVEAAPDMLEALRTSVGMFRDFVARATERHDVSWKLAREAGKRLGAMHAAIAKAEGRE